MLLILGECRGMFATTERLWWERYPDWTPHSRNFFHVWLNESKLKMSFILFKISFIHSAST